MTYWDLDKSKLTDLQRRNLATWMIKKYQMEQQHGDKIVVMNSIDDVLAMTSPLALPLHALDTKKQVSIILDEEREDLDGSVTLVRSRDNTSVDKSISDVTRELEALVEVYEQVKQARKNRGRKPSKQEIPAGCKVVKHNGREYIIPADMELVDPSNVSEDKPEEPTADLSVAEKPVNELGVTVDKKASRKEAMRELLDMLI